MIYCGQRTLIIYSISLLIVSIIYIIYSQRIRGRCKMMSFYTCYYNNMIDTSLKIRFVVGACHLSNK